MSKWYSKLITENAYGYGIKVSAFLAGLVFTVAFPRILGAEGYGYYSLALALANFWVFFSDFGIQDAMIKFISASALRGNTREYIRFFSKWKYLLTVLSSLALFVLSDFLAAYVFRKPALGFGIKAGSMYLFFTSLLMYYTAIFVGLMKNRVVFVSSLIYNAARVILPVALLYVAFDYSVLLFGTALAAIAGVAFYVHSLSREKIPSSNVEVDAAGVRKFIFYGSMGFLGVMLINWMGSIVLGVFQDPADVGFYGIALKWVSAVGLLLPISSSILFSFYAGKHEEEKRYELERTFAYSVKYSLILSFLAVVGLIVLSPYFVFLLYGPEYSMVSPLLMVLSFLSIEIALQTVVPPILYGVGRIDVATKYLLLIGVISTALNAVAASSYGVIGVAVATTVTRLGGILILLAYTKRLLRIRFDALEYIKPGLCAVATFLVLYPLQNRIVSLPMGVVFFFAVIVLYSLLLFATKTLKLEELTRLIPREL